jgi:hypothetical protein
MKEQNNFNENIGLKPRNGYNESRRYIGKCIAVSVQRKWFLQYNGFHNGF